MVARPFVLALALALTGLGLGAPSDARAAIDGEHVRAPVGSSSLEAVAGPGGICSVGESPLPEAPHESPLSCAQGLPRVAAPYEGDATSGAGDWTIVASPNAKAAFPRSVLQGVTCVSASDCWAVGYTFTGSTFATLIEHWDGSDWTVTASPNPGELEASVLYDVECSSTSDCWAVGYSASATSTRTLIERWDGTSWTIVASPNVSTLDYLRDVTCVSASDCWTVGYAYSGLNGASETLALHWNGISWQGVESPNPDPTRGSSFLAVTCASSSSCWAAGGAAGGTLIERWNGTSWSIFSSPNNTVYESNNLSAVTCASEVDCWAVGLSVTDNEWRTLVEHWDGTSWTITTSANRSIQMNYLDDVTCLSANDCWAVGGFTTGNKWRTLTQRWDGTSWTSVDAPSSENPEGNFTTALACLSTTDCWTVGSAWTSKAITTVVARWHSTAGGAPEWRMVASPNTFAHNANVLSSVACASPSDCWAVGHYSPEPNSTTQTLIEHWDGSAWSIVPSPNVGLSSNVLSDVTCVSASDCWAAGHSLGDSGARTLTLHWNGTAWDVIPSANMSSQPNFLFGVACTSATNCWTVGKYHNGSLAKTLIQRWDGTSWNIVPSPNPSSQTVSARQRNVLSDVTCVSPSDCWAVGSYDVDSPVQPDDLVRQKTSRTLTQRWDGTSWTTVPSPDTAAIEQHSLSGVTCTSASDCWAVGSSYNAISPQTFAGAQEAAGTAQQTLIKRWNGSAWTVVTSPNTSATQQNILSAVGCLSASDCWAVGYHDVNGTLQTLIQRWDGTSWAQAPSPNTSATERNVLSGIACVSGSDCWAAGSSQTGSVPRTLAAGYTDAASTTEGG